MITNVTSTPQTPVTPASQSSSSSGPITYHTPFGDVLVDRLSAPDMLAEFDPRAAAARASTAKTVTTPDGGVLPASAAAPVTASAAAATTTATTPATTAAATTSAPTTPTPTTPAGPPTAQSVFGANPWMQNPGGVGLNGVTWLYNPIYFATQQTAQQVANLVGGTVVQENAMLGNISTPFHQTVQNNMVELSDGAIINPGLVADFYDHGYSQSFVNQMIQNEVKGAEQSVENQTQGV